MARRKTRRVKRRKTAKRRPARRASRRKPVAKKMPLAKWIFILGLIAMLLSFTGIYSATIGITLALIMWLIAMFLVR